MWIICSIKNTPVSAFKTRADAAKAGVRSGADAGMREIATVRAWARLEGSLALSERASNSVHHERVASFLRCWLILLALRMKSMALVRSNPHCHGKSGSVIRVPARSQAGTTKDRFGKGHRPIIAVRRPLALSRAKAASNGYPASGLLCNWHLYVFCFCLEWGKQARRTRHGFVA